MPLPLERRDEICALVAGHAAVEVVVLFGSRANGVVHARSDHDLAFGLVAGTTLALLDELGLQDRLTTCLGGEVDLVPFDAADPILKREIIRGGQLVFERTAGAWARRCADGMLEYLDLEPLLIAGRDRYLRRLGTGS